MKLRLLPLLLWLPLTVSAELSGNLAVEWQSFPNEGAYADQLDDDISVSLKPRWTGESGDALLSAEVFVRAGSADEERNHSDIRELLWLYVDGDNEWRIGINTMFWGVTESQHLVDIVNQIDLYEGIDGEEKLGQPMVHYKRYEDWGVIDALLLPGFRERQFPGEDGRLRTPLLVDSDQASYESSDEENHVDVAFRYAHFIGDLDFGLTLFSGTSRDPVLQAGLDEDFNPVLIPYYPLITQVGLDAQWIVEDWLWKLEWIQRDADDFNYSAYTAGFEYSFYGIMESDTDLGAIVEYSYDDRDEGERGIFDRELFLGARFAFNDEQSSEILAGLIVDTEKDSQSFRVEGNRRIGDSWKATIELQLFDNVDEDDPLFAFAEDDYLQVEMAYFF